MYDQIASNKRRSIALVAGFVVVLALVGAAVGLLIGNGVVFTLLALVIAGVVAFVSYWKADAVALRVSRARPADPEQYKRLHNLVEGLCIAGGLPKPGVYVIDDPAPNAFATGRNPKHAAIAVTTGLLEKMNRIELEGVVAHELSHIRHYDILVSTLAVTLVGSIALLTDIAIRTMWWNGGRVSRSGDRENSNNPLAVVGFVLLIVAPDHRQGDAGGDLQAPRNAGRHRRLSAHPVPAGTDLGARKAEGRHDGDARSVDCYGTLVDRTTDERGGRQRSAGRHSPDVRHSPSARRAHRIAERTVTRINRRTIAVALVLATLAACSSGGDAELDHDDAPNPTTTSTTTPASTTTVARSTTTTSSTRHRPPPRPRCRKC